MKTQAVFAYPPKSPASLLRFFISSALLFLVASVDAAVNDGWLRDKRSVTPPDVTTAIRGASSTDGSSQNVSLHDEFPRLVTTKTVSKGTLASTPDSQTTEILSLTRSILNSPDNYIGWAKIFFFVSTQLEYEHYYGCKKGAQLTLLERKGNDADLGTLLVAMLRAAGYEARYGYGVVGFLTNDNPQGPVNILSWLGVSLNALSPYNATRGFPVTYVDGPYRGINRVWVEVWNGSQWIRLDPACKKRVRVLSGMDTGAATGYSRAALKVASGGTVTTASEIRGINEAGLSEYLAGCASNLLARIAQTSHHADPLDLLGGWRTEPFSTTNVARMLFPGDLWELTEPVQHWTNIPAGLCTTISIEVRDSGFSNGPVVASASFPTALLQGGKLSLAFSTNTLAGRAQLWLDDTLIAEETASPVATTINVRVGIDHSHSNGLGATLHDQFGQRSYRRGATYVLTYAFNPSSDLLRNRQNQLDAYRRAGLSDSSRQVVSETLNVMGLTWMHQTELFQRVLAGKVNCDPLYHHRIGRVSQERGYYIDVDVQFSGFFSLDGNDPVEDQAWYARNYVDSAMEHAVLEQLQGSSNQAVSTVKLLRLANRLAGAEGTIFYATPSTWPTIQGQLQNYSSSDLSTIQNAIAAGGEVLLPLRGNLVLNQWTGAGYITRVSTNRTLAVAMKISGDLMGGYVSRVGNVSPQNVSRLGNANPVRVNTTPAAVRTVFGEDPIDLASGDYYFAATDLEVGNASPRGLVLARQYHGGRRWVNLAGLGYGWTHNWNVRATQRSAYEPAMGVSGSPFDIASTMVAVHVLLDLESAITDAQHWTLASLVAHWLTDQLQDNAVAISIGEKSLQFIRRADNVWQAPGGVTSTLSSNSVGWVLTERHGNLYRFDTQRRLEQIVDLWGKTLTITYADDRIASVRDAYGRSFNFVYTSNLLAQVFDSAGRSILFNYDTNSNLVAITDPEGIADRFSYDSEHRIVEVRNHDSEVIAINLYDDVGKVVEQRSHGDTNRTWRYYYAPAYSLEENPRGGRTYSFFDQKKRVTGQRNALGHVWQRRYDGQDRVTQTITPLGRTILRTYDAFHNVLAVTDPDGLTTTNGYDGEQRLIITRNPLGHTSGFRYNIQHRPTHVTNALGQVTTHVYNSNGTVASTSFGGETNTFNYNARDELIGTAYSNGDSISSERNIFGDTTLFTDSRNNRTVTTFNRRRQPLTVTLPGGATTTNAYNTSRQLAASTDARGNTTRFAYSVTGKLLVTTLPDNSRRVNTYDTRDWLGSSVNEQNETNAFVYTAAGHLRQQRDPLNRVTTYQYDADDSLTNTINPLGHSMGQEFNARGLVVATRDPLGKYSTNLYDNGSRRIGFINRRGYRYTFSFDELNRQVSVVTPGGRTNAQAWNELGLLASARQPSGKTTTIEYDPRGRERVRNDLVGTVTRVLDGNGNAVGVIQGTQTIARNFDARDRALIYSDGRGHTLEYSYDANGNLASLTYEVGKTVTYSYDTRDRLRSITDWTGRITRLSYDAVGRLIRIDRPNGVRRDIGYDLAGQLSKVEERNLASQEPVIALRVNYDNGGRLSHKLELPAWPTSPLLPQRPIVNNSDNQILQFDGTAIIHDADGNTLTAPAPRGGNSESYSWNARNQLTGYSTNLTYSYDGEGHRTAYSLAGQVTTFVNDPHSVLSRVLIRQRPDGSRTFYIYGPVLLYELEESSGEARFYHYDHFGSTIALTKDDGQVVGRANYSGYGQLIQQKGVLNTPFLWQGAFGVQTDPNGLIFMRARYYHAHMGRFLSEDPLGLSAGPNVYAYANGNPITANDPTGQYLETAWDLFNVALDIHSLRNNVRQGNVGAALLDTVGLVLDAAAVALPVVPGGAGAALHTVRAGESVVESVGALRRADSVPSVSQFLQQGAANTHVYLGVRDGEPVYAGITSDIARRQAQHGDRFILQPITSEPVTRNQARAIEQALIERSPHFENRINSISPQRPEYQEAVDWGNQWIRRNIK